MSARPTLPPRTRRKNFWEAIYNPSIADQFTAGDWANLEREQRLKLFKGDQLKSSVLDKRQSPRFEQITFDRCDFTGEYKRVRGALVFKDCRFTQCDFGSSVWDRTKFTECTFDTCSITQSSWSDCEFRQCSWRQISMAGNETQLVRVYVSNPSDFISAAYTNLDPAELSTRNVQPSFQRTRLEETKATVARSLYESHRHVGDDPTFHEVCRVFTLQGINARRSDLRYRLESAEGFQAVQLGTAAFVTTAELHLTRAFGAANNWGLSLIRPLAMLGLTFLVFWLVNWLLLGEAWSRAAERSFDVTSVAGYTKAVSSSDPPYVQLVAATNLCIAIFFYSVFFSTAVAKVSRFR